MSERDGGEPNAAWWGDRVWSLNGEVAALKQAQQGLAAGDAQRRQEIRELGDRFDRDLRELRESVQRGFEGLARSNDGVKTAMDVQLGSMRAELVALKPAAASLTRVERGPERDGPDGWSLDRLPLRWMFILAVLVIVTVAATAFGIGAAWRAGNTAAVLQNQL